MSNAPKILVFAGSARAGSFNKRLAAAAAGVAGAAGASATLTDLRDHEMPLYDGDLERDAGLPPGARSFRALLEAHDGMLIASPEYNSSISPLLKNTIDWCTRPDGDKPSIAFGGQIAALVAASPGRLGGLRGLVHVRAILQNIGVMVVPKQLALSHADKAFDEQGNIADSGQRAALEQVVRSLVETVKRMTAGS